ncbi:hypothetical protein GCK32_004455 [Trichostrongylus colubriformis]|uniref:Uncharacterized protein n=1 Tax=Trichostrongylus colubriformis TaxID=6319 RepID=A0AAN8F4K8_TRICO
MPTEREVRIRSREEVRPEDRAEPPRSFVNKGISREDERETPCIFCEARGYHFRMMYRFQDCKREGANHRTEDSSTRHPQLQQITTYARSASSTDSASHLSFATCTSVIGLFRRRWWWMLWNDGLSYAMREVKIQGRNLRQRPAMPHMLLTESS